MCWVRVEKGEIKVPSLPYKFSAEAPEDKEVSDWRQRIHEGWYVEEYVQEERSETPSRNRMS